MEYFIIALIAVMWGWREFVKSMRLNTIEQELEGIRIWTEKKDQQFLEIQIRLTFLFKRLIKNRTTISTHQVMIPESFDLLERNSTMSFPMKFLKKSWRLIMKEIIHNLFCGNVINQFSVNVRKRFPTINWFGEILPRAFLISWCWALKNLV